MTNSEKELSLILCSRNDSYMGNSNWRLQASLNLTLKHAAAAGKLDKIEILVCDWGSLAALRDVIALSPRAEGVVSFIEVPRHVAEFYQKDSPFAEVIALNAAARRASGKYIGRIDADTIVGEGAFRELFQLFEGKYRSYFRVEKSVLFSMRRRIPYRLVEQELPTPLIRSLITFLRGCFVLESIRGEPFYRCYVGIFMMHRDLWYESTGYDESLLYWGFMETDLVYRLAPKYRTINIGDYMAHDFYHLEHYHPRRSRTTYRHWNEMKYPGELAPNVSDAWGLSELNFQVAPVKTDDRSSAGKGLLSLFRAMFGLFFAIGMMILDGIHRKLYLKRAEVK
jgi:hypothetical protein